MDKVYDRQVSQKETKKNGKQMNVQPQGVRKTQKPQ